MFNFIEPCFNCFKPDNLALFLLDAHAYVIDAMKFFILAPSEPHINNLYLVNGSTVKINWSEPVLPNGKITKYEVSLLGINIIKVLRVDDQVN